MNCIFLRRGYEETESYEKFTSLAEMFAGAERYAIKGRNAATAGTFSISNIPTTGTYYIFSFVNGAMAVDKLKDGSKELLLTTMTGRFSAASYLSGTTLYFSQTGTNATSAYNATMAMLSFPTFKESAVDAAIAAISVNKYAGWSGSSTSRAGLSSSDCTGSDVVIAATNALMSVYLGSSVTSSTALTTIFDAGSSSAASYSSSYGLNCGNNYGSSVLAVSSSGI